MTSLFRFHGFLMSTSYDSVFQSTSSMRDQLLAESSPIRNLLISMLIIACLFFGVFLSWVYFRRKSKQDLPLTSYGQLYENEEDFDIESLSPSAKHNLSDLKSEDALKTQVSVKEPTSVELPQAALIGLARNKEASSKIHEGMLNTINDSPISVVDRSDVDFSIEALIATHKRQSDQRERFIHDRRNIGLRYMAIQQIRMQQKYEKQIMLIKSRNTVPKK